MMNMKKFIIGGIALAGLISLLTCSSVGSIASKGAELAGNAGLIDANTQAAITASGEALGKAFEDITPEQEYYIGRAVAANILTNYKVYGKDPALVTYLNKICDSITVDSSRPEIFNGYHLNILDSDEINAFSTSGGHIFVTRGLIQSATTEDMLAGVIAHEIAHIQLQHSLKSIKSSRLNSALMATGVNAAGAATGQDVKQLTDVFNESVGDILNTMLNSGYSRDQEFEADSFALGLMAGTGYYPPAFISMLKNLETLEAKHTSDAHGFTKTHPSPTDRIKNAEKTVNNYPIPDNQAVRQPRFVK